MCGSREDQIILIQIISDGAVKNRESLNVLPVIFFYVFNEPHGVVVKVVCANLRN